MDDDKQPTPIGPINLSLKLGILAPTRKRRLKWAIYQERCLERRYGGGSYMGALKNYWHALDGPARSILEVLK